jgi:hypothetical protein
MLQTGSPSGSPLNTLGSETFGGQAFLQAPFVALFSFAGINIADAVFCFGMLVLLIGGLTSGRPRLALIAILSMVVVWLFEPQYASVTALYSAAALMSAVVVLSIDQREYAVSGSDAPPSAVIGLLYAALMALKPTFGLFIAAHFLFCFLAEVYSTRALGACVRRAGAVVMWSAIFVLPWVLIYSPLYWAAFIHPQVPPDLVPPVPMQEAVDFISTKALFYGGSYALYTFAAATFLVCGGMVWARATSYGPAVARFIGICIAVPFAYVVMLLVAAPLLAGVDTALRHFLPIMIGTLPVILVMSGEITGQPHRSLGGWDTVPLALAVLLIAFFAPAAWIRYDFLLRSGAMLSYLRNWPAQSREGLLAASKSLLDGSVARQLTEWQQHVPEREPILVWHSAPFLLDFTRNPIVDVDIGGIPNPWSKTPSVKYVLWQYRGFGVRQPSDYVGQMKGPGRRETYLAARGLAYARDLQAVAERAQPIRNDGYTILVRLP